MFDKQRVNCVYHIDSLMKLLVNLHETVESVHCFSNSKETMGFCCTIKIDTCDYIIQSSVKFFLVNNQ